MPEKKCSVIAIIGAPNAGKSTLINHLVGQKISIVTPKVQTTRIKVTGIVVCDETQLVFIDTPGIFTPKKKMQKAMVKEAWSALNQADEIIFIVDSKKARADETEALIKQLSRLETTPILVLNKVDKIEKHNLLPIAEELNGKMKFEQIFMISALKGDGTEDLKNYLIKKAKKSEWRYPEDQVSDLPMKLLAAEETREKLFLALQQEIPYGLMVETEKWDETKNKVDIYQVIYVNREGHKNIIIGKGGSLIKQIGQKARKSLENMLGKKVNLFLHVKYQENWDENKIFLRSIGFNE